MEVDDDAVAGRAYGDLWFLGLGKHIDSFYFGVDLGEPVEDFLFIWVKADIKNREYVCFEVG